MRSCVTELEGVVYSLFMSLQVLFICHRKILNLACIRQKTCNLPWKKILIHSSEEREEI